MLAINYSFVTNKSKENDVTQKNEEQMRIYVKNVSNGHIFISYFSN